ncbi:hypothetical protein ACQPW3_14410 [Actinosynnema sp. CA-248983]
MDGRPFVRDSGDAPAISGTSGDRWVDVRVPLTAYAGQNTKLRFAYRTDGGLALQGFFADAITVTADGAPVLLVSLWDTSFLDNNTSEHPGEGLILPIDANPAPIYHLEGRPWSPTVGGYDAPSGLQKSDSSTLHINGKASCVRGQPARPVFDDTSSSGTRKRPRPA